MSYKLISVDQYRQENFRFKSDFCKAIGVKRQQYNDYLSHFILIDKSGKEKPVLITKGKTVNLP